MSKRRRHPLPLRVAGEVADASDDRATTLSAGLFVDVCGQLLAQIVDARRLLPLLATSKEFSRALVACHGGMRVLFETFNLPGKYAPDEHLCLAYMRLMVRHMYDSKGSTNLGYTIGHPASGSPAKLYRNLWRVDPGAVEQVNRRVRLAKEAREFVAQLHPDCDVPASAMFNSYRDHHYGLDRELYGLPTDKWMEYHQAVFAYTMLSTPTSRPTAEEVRAYRQPVRMNGFHGHQGVYSNWSHRQVAGPRCVSARRARALRTCQCCICFLPIAHGNDVMRTINCTAHLDCFDQFFALRV